ncbi:hypothetical protein AB0K20_07330 [Micromonospora matsumotoense]|uniref:hypothetical protein n=1 Tax=Micromonospora matsumotoense TaxID=121616 RepID=UPI0034358B38
MVSARLKSLERLPDPVRSDYLRIVERTIEEVSTRWSSVLSVPVLWLTLGAVGTDIRVERVDLDGLYRENGYAEHFDHWVESAVRQRMGTGRCAALASHDRMGGPWPYPTGALLPGLPDGHVHLRAVHRDDPGGFADAFAVRSRPLRRKRFAPEVYEQLAQARRAYPGAAG